MAEIYKNSNDPIKAKIFWKGELVRSSSSVVAVVYDITQDPTIVPPINPNNQIGIFTAVEEEVNPGTYSIYLPLSLTTRNKKLKVVWQVVVGAQAETLTTYCDVVTPYVSLSEVIDDLNLGAESSDPLYKSYHDLQMAEKYARKTVESYTGQKFYLHDDTFSIMGNDSDSIQLPKRIHQIHKLYQNDQLWIDNISNINNLGYVVEPTVSKFGIKINQSSLLNNDTYISNGMVPPSIYDISPDIFRRGRTYKVSGRFGYEFVPDPVEQATIELMRTYFARDRVWRDQYVKKMSTTDWDFEYSSQVFSGTGSAYADKLLQDYVITEMVVV